MLRGDAARVRQTAAALEQRRSATETVWAVDNLLVLVTDQHVSTRSGAAWALKILAPGLAVTPLIDLLDVADPQVRRTAAADLAALGDERAVGPLARAITDPDAGVQAAAVHALVRLGGERGNGLLVEAFADVPTDLHQIVALASVGSGRSVTCVDGLANTSAIAALDFELYELVAIVSDRFNTMSGGLSCTENEALLGRSNDIAAFINGGGGLLAFSSTGLTTQNNLDCGGSFGGTAGPFGYLAQFGTFTFHKLTTQVPAIIPTAEGIGAGVTAPVSLCCWHDQFIDFPPFLDILAHYDPAALVDIENMTTRSPCLAVDPTVPCIAVIGGVKVVVSGFLLTPGTATNVVGENHTVTITVTVNGAPEDGVDVSFAVTAGPNSGLTLRAARRAPPVLASARPHIPVL